MYGCSPVMASYSSAPLAYQSAAGPMGRDAACSGAMYAAVPTTVSSLRSRDTLCSHTRPKSTSTTRPSWVTSTLAGLTSRWTLPAACRDASP